MTPLRDAVAYWTPERMASAIPKEQVLSVASVGRAEDYGPYFDTQVCNFWKGNTGWPGTW